jgi:Zn-dependent metalloprotease
MVINPMDRKNVSAAAAQSAATQQKAAPQAQEIGKTQQAEAPVAAPRAPESDSFSSLRLPGGAASARRATNLAEKAASIKAQRRASRAPSDSAAQLIGAGPPSPPLRSTVLSPSSAAGQKAVKTTLDYLDQRMGSQGQALTNAAVAPDADASKDFATRSIERDELGMTHVRMDRKFEGVPVFGEQVVSHLDKDGNVAGLSGGISSIPAGLGTQPTNLSKDQALQAAAQDFAGPTDRPPTAERVVAKGPDGQYHAAWHVKMTNTAGPERPRQMNYLIDAQTGQQLQKFNQIDSIELRKKPAAADTVTVTGSAAPNAAIPDQGKVVSSITLDQDVDVSKLKLGVDINHTYSGDLKLTLTSPSGKAVVVQDRKGGASDDIKKSFDVSDFAGESTKGEWKLTVEDMAARDTGKLNNWNLSIDGVAKTPPPGPVDSVTKTVAPNAPINDNSTVTSTIDVPESFDIDKFNLNLDIAHTYIGDLKVSLTSPSGKTAVVHNHEGGSTDNITGQFDLASTFAGEKVQGQWKLTVEDNAAQDTGTLKSWGFTATAKGVTPPPPPPPPGQADDTTMYSGKVDLGALKQNADGTFQLDDSTRGKGVNTYDAKGSQQPTTKTEIKDNNNVWGEASDPKNAQAGVDAQYGGETTYDFYKNVLGRDSLDGKGEALNAFVHVGKNYVNAFWDGEKMNYGDGDGQQAGPLTTLDIAGHEISHGLTERTSGLVYSGESGGLNEAMSDIMGTGVEWYASQKNPAVKFDWKLGEDAWTPGTAGDALRYMDDPTKDGYSIDNYKNYPQQTEVHGSSGIANNAFYLLSQGGTNRTSGMQVADGIGVENALKVFYRANAYYLTPNSTFADARDATLKAATDLFGASSTQVQRVKDSWSAVGVESKA